MNTLPLEMRVAYIPITAEGILAFSTVWPQLRRSIRRFARFVTPDRDQQDDLVQEAMIALWNADVTRYDFRNRRDVAYMRGILINRMWDVWGGDAVDVSPDTMADGRALAAALLPS